MPNYNSETGIPFGVIDARRVHWLHEEIIQSGDSLSYREFLNETDRLIETFLSNADESAKDFFDDYCYDETAIANFQAEVDEISDWDEVDAETLEALRLILVEDAYLEFECESFRYEKDGEIYELSHLGGAPLIWAIRTPTLAPGRNCSPCCPGAIDLDNAEEGGFLAYAPPAHWFGEGECPYADWIVLEDDYLREDAA